MLLEFQVFVYGSLKKGHGNHVCCEGYLRMREATMVGSLYDLGYFPALKVPEHLIMTWGTSDYDGDVEIQGYTTPRKIEGEVVYGELYTFDEPFLLQRLDTLEGHPNFYQRVLMPVWVDNEVESAWTYTINHLGNYNKIKSGRWPE